MRLRLPFLLLRSEERPRFAAALAGVAALACDHLHVSPCLQLPLAKNLHGDLLWVRFDESRFGDWDLPRPFLSFPFLPDGLGLLFLLELPQLEDRWDEPERCSYLQLGRVHLPVFAYS